MKAGTNYVKKMKQEQRNQASMTRTNKYSLDKPPQVFIRRAVESSDEEEEKPRKKQSPAVKKYKEVREEPKFNSDDFPTLT